MIDLNKHAEAMLEAFDCHVFGDTLEAYWERRRAAILTACAALADDAARAMRDQCAAEAMNTVLRASISKAVWDAVRAIQPASLRGEK